MRMVTGMLTARVPHTSNQENDSKRYECRRCRCVLHERLNMPGEFLTGSGNYKSQDGGEQYMAGASQRRNTQRGSRGPAVGSANNGE